MDSEVQAHEEQRVSSEVQVRPCSLVITPIVAALELRLGRDRHCRHHRLFLRRLHHRHCLRLLFHQKDRFLSHFFSTRKLSIYLSIDRDLSPPEAEEQRTRSELHYPLRARRRSSRRVRPARLSPRSSSPRLRTRQSLQLRSSLRLRLQPRPADVAKMRRGHVLYKLP